MRLSLNFLNIALAISISIGQTLGFAAYYDERPHISKVTGTNSKGWDKLKGHKTDLLTFFEGTTSVAALLFEFYGDYDIFMLARDGEMLYDVSYLHGTPAERKRLHLVNVSTNLSTDKKAITYLKQNGFVPGQNNLFIDSGYAGSIIDTIRQRSKTLKTTKGLLMTSHSPETYPQLDIFTSRKCSGAHCMVDTLEDGVPHFTDSAEEYHKGDKGQLRAFGPESSESDQAKALQIMKQIVSYAKSAEAKENFKTERSIWKFIKRLGQEGKALELQTFLAVLEKAKSERNVYADIASDARHIIVVHQFFPKNVQEALTREIEDEATSIKVKYEKGLLGKILSGQVLLGDVLENAKIEPSSAMLDTLVERAAGPKDYATLIEAVTDVHTSIDDQKAEETLLVIIDKIDSSKNSADKKELYSIAEHFTNFNHMDGSEKVAKKLVKVAVSSGDPVLAEMIVDNVFANLDSEAKFKLGRKIYKAFAKRYPKLMVKIATEVFGTEGPNTYGEFEKYYSSFANVLIKSGNLQAVAALIEHGSSSGDNVIKPTFLKLAEFAKSNGKSMLNTMIANQAQHFSLTAKELALISVPSNKCAKKVNKK